MKTNTAETGGTDVQLRTGRWALLLLMFVAVMGMSGCADYYGAYPAYGRGYYASNYYGAGYGYDGSPYGYSRYPYYGYNRYPYGYGAPYGYGGAAITIRSGGYRDRYNRWHNREVRPHQQVQNQTQVRTTTRTKPRRTTATVQQSNVPQVTSEPVRQP